MTALTEKGAVLAFDDSCRLLLERRAPDTGRGLGRAPDTGRPVVTYGWLMCNPSRADALDDDPTIGRVCHHTERNGGRRALVGNVWPYRTPYPADLWAALKAGEITNDMMRANLDMLAGIGAQSDVLIMAFGAAPGREHLAAVKTAVGAILVAYDAPVYALGTTEDGWPLHPLARGKLAIRNDTELTVWNALGKIAFANAEK